MKFYDYRGNVLPTVKSYFQDELETTANSVRALRTEPCLVFPLCTDIHYLSATSQVPHSFDTMIRNMDALSNLIRLDFVACLGDVVDGESTRSVTVNQLQHIFDGFRSLDMPLMFSSGNHDANRYGSDTPFTLDELFKFEYYGRRNDATGGQNWYLDFANFKIRFIGLCTTSTGTSGTAYAYPTGTDVWLTGVLDGVPEGYTVVLLEHLSPIAEHNWNRTLPTGASGVLSAVNTWLAADNSNRLIEFIGHAHSDYSFTSPWLTICTTCQKAETVFTEDKTADPSKHPAGAKQWKMTPGTATEDCWDVVVLRPESKKVNCIRFGAGEDREFTY